uniref:Uncharacterized protein n=1 Tax=Arundo donax TaxID=35708 RepID=A0A0A9E8R9_ARUDO
MFSAALGGATRLWNLQLYSWALRALRSRNPCALLLCGHCTLPHVYTRVLLFSISSGSTAAGALLFWRNSTSVASSFISGAGMRNLLPVASMVRSASAAASPESGFWFPASSPSTPSTSYSPELALSESAPAAEDGGGRAPGCILR